MTEYFDRFDVPGGDSLLVVTQRARRPGVPGDAVLDEPQFKRAERRVGLEPDAVLGAMRRRT